MKRREDRGNGDVCPIDIDHGKMYMLISGQQFCPHAGHDKRGSETPALYANDGMTAARTRKRTEAHA